ncbi:PREDICTED: uncharacterized protein LOC101817671 isoform X2 [Ficedula albicollis]|uniref:uncharacterized protein LOC101817671 isoform X2 n=1 Tax=Ficedula albicollis TaxID=59894 RepID=UPI000359E614|nr:PREDICTED: uncharacterized protein LOC101817671 isoform X2 [Ficedula albicollis]
MGTGTLRAHLECCRRRARAAGSPGFPQLLPRLGLINDSLKPLPEALPSSGLGAQHSQRDLGRPWGSRGLKEFQVSRRGVGDKGWRDRTLPEGWTDGILGRNSQRSCGCPWIPGIFRAGFGAAPSRCCSAIPSFGSFSGSVPSPQSPKKLPKNPSGHSPPLRAINRNPGLELPSPELPRQPQGPVPAFCSTSLNNLLSPTLNLGILPLERGRVWRALAGPPWEANPDNLWRGSAENSPEHQQKLATPGRLSEPAWASGSKQQRSPSSPGARGTSRGPQDPRASPGMSSGAKCSPQRHCRTKGDTWGH